MRKSFYLIIFIISLFAQNSFSQNYNWITPNKTYLKMYVAQDGMYRINRSDFVNAGVNVSSIDPRTIRLINKGNEIPVYFSGEGDGTFDQADYFDFFGTRNYGGMTITYDHANFLSYVTDEYYNLYSDTNVYWVDWGGNNGQRYAVSDYNSTSNYSPDFFTDKVHLEKDFFYAIGESYAATDYRYLSTEKFRGEGWYWSFLGDNQALTDSLSTPLINNNGTASVRIFAYPSNRDINVINEHTIEIKINGTVIGTAYKNDLNPVDTTLNFPASLLSESGNIFSVKYIPAPGTSGGMFIDFVEVKYPRRFRIMNNNLSAKLNAADTTSKLFSVAGYNSSNALNIYDVVNHIKINAGSFSSDSVKLTAKSSAHIVLINDAINRKPFRIKQRQVPNLVSASNAADYLIVYNNLFNAQAEQLRAYRQSHDNFRSVKTEIEDIYDIFNYGLENPVAVKNFTKYVYDNWQQPRLQYICLFGRGSLDPKKNSAGSVYYNNLVPVYGNPPSDGYFANINVGTFFYYDQISIGRLPAYSVAEAQTMVDKIIAYESEPAARWWKDFIYITGGGTLSDQLYHQQRSNNEINVFITPYSISGSAHKIYRTDDSSSVTYNYADSVKNDISRGCVFVNYRGHAGSHDWEVGMQDPNTLTNGNKLPIVVSLTCFTGENSKTELRGFGEKFIYLPNKGAIGFIGTTGWSYSTNGNDFGTYLVQTMKDDTSRRVGELMKYAGKQMSRDSLSFSIRHTINCYNLLGDPAVKIKLPKQPEFEITNNDYRFLNETNNTGEQISLKIFPKNYGLFADSCLIRFQLKKYNQPFSFKDTVYRNFKFLDTIQYNFKIDTIGIYYMTVSLDHNNRFPEENETNNSITFNVPITSTSYIPMSPANFALVYRDTIELSGLNPNFKHNQKSVKVSLELDTSSAFNSPVRKTFLNSAVSGAVTKFRTGLPVLNNNTVYFWRTSAIVNNDTSYWSKKFSFTYVHSGKNTFELFRPVTENIPVFLTKTDPEQYSENEFDRTNYGSDGIKLSEYTANLYVKSLGSNAEEASYFTVGNQTVFIDGGLNTGLNILKVRKSNGHISAHKNLKMISAASSDSLVNFLNTFDTTYYVMLLNAAYVPGGTYLTANAKNKLRQFGSIYCDSIGLMGYFHTWSLIGYLGASHSQTSEMFDPCCRPAPLCNSCSHWTASVSSLNVTFTKTSGTVSNIIGPAQVWTDFSWSQILSENSSLKFDVIGISYTGQQTLLFSDITSNKFVDLSTISAVDYPRLNFFAKFAIDTLIGAQSSVLTGIYVNYTPGLELVLDRNSVQVNTSSKSTDVHDFSFDYHNAGFSYMRGAVVNLFAGASLLLTDTIPSTLKYDSAMSYSNSFNSPQFRDSLQLRLEIKPNGNYNEFYSFNNSAGFTLISRESKPSFVSEIEILSDGKVISNGDYVSKNPEIKINGKGAISLNVQSDTTQVSLLLNDRYIPFFVNGSANPLLKSVSISNYSKSSERKNNSANETAKSPDENSIYYYPELKAGTNILTVIYKTAGNENGNEVNEIRDTVSYEVFVSEELMVKDLYNYPNPMKDQTSFIFTIASPDAPDNFKIRIYSVSGRIIREIVQPVNIGQNQIQWDGKDNDGDYVSNGTYFYKIVTQDETSANFNNTETQIQKLVVLR